VNDTSDDVQRVMRERLQQLSPEARIHMACGMLSAGRELARAGARARSPASPWGREQMLIRLYSNDLPTAVIAAVTRRLRGEEDNTSPAGT